MTAWAVESAITTADFSSAFTTDLYSALNSAFVSGLDSVSSPVFESAFGSDFLFSPPLDGIDGGNIDGDDDFIEGNDFIGPIPLLPALFVTPLLPTAQGATPVTTAEGFLGTFWEDPCREEPPEEARNAPMAPRTVRRDGSILKESLESRSAGASPSSSEEEEELYNQSSSALFSSGLSTERPKPFTPPSSGDRE